MPDRTLADATNAKEDYTGYRLDEETGLHYAGPRYYFSALGRFDVTDRFADKEPGLSRCGVSDGSAKQRGSLRIGQPIRGPGAEQGRQPQRVQPGGFFRPLFGRSKRGHPDGSDYQDSCMQAEVRNRTFYRTR